MNQSNLSILAKTAHTVVNCITLQLNTTTSKLKSDLNVELSTGKFMLSKVLKCISSDFVFLF